MGSVENTPMGLASWLFLLALSGAITGCGAGGSGSAATTGTPIPTAPAGLPGLDAPSSGFNVQTSLAPVPPVAPVPQMTGGDILDRDAAIRLGKALFWDMQAGSDGQMACASCHFMAGADDRTFNTIHPGPDAAFTVVALPGVNFPFVTFDGLSNDDAVGSSGVFSMRFTGIAADLSDPVDVCAPAVPADASQAVLAAAGQRLVTGRNTPPVIGAVFNLDNFWDGRASHDFNGQDPLGGGTVIAGNASLASQAVGPPLSDVEMSCAGRTWNGPNSLGAKLVVRTPLALQLVDPTDSVLGALSNAPSKGLTARFPDRSLTYADLIAAAFGTKGLSNEAAVQFYINNFASIWGQAVQAYEATLVPDRTPYDLGTLSANQIAGLQAMRTAGCTACHVEPEFTDASVRAITANGGTGVQKITNGGPGGDQGFHNIGSSLIANDRGRAATRTYFTSNFNEGAFKTAALRNVKLTAPYMHNGAIADLTAVLAFYNGNNQDQASIGFDLSARVPITKGNEPAAVVDFLTNGLTDPRVEQESAPFDHPSLVIPNGATLPAVGRLGK